VISSLPYPRGVFSPPTPGRYEARGRDSLLPFDWRSPVPFFFLQGPPRLFSAPLNPFEDFFPLPFRSGLTTAVHVPRLLVYSKSFLPTPFSECLLRRYVVTSRIPSPLSFSSGRTRPATADTPKKSPIFYLSPSYYLVSLLKLPFPTTGFPNLTSLSLPPCRGSDMRFAILAQTLLVPSPTDLSSPFPTKKSPFVWCWDWCGLVFGGLSQSGHRPLSTLIIVNTFWGFPPIAVRAQKVFKILVAAGR